MLRHLAGSFAGIICLVIASAPASAQIVGEKKVNLTVPRNATVAFAMRGFFDNQFCRVEPSTLFKLHASQNPTLGRFIARNETYTIEKDDGSSGHGGCVGVQVPVTRVYFQAGPKPGRETAQFFLMGEVSYQYDVTIEVK